ncbi:MAG: class I SAM-dependent methyltransferase [Methanobacteriota archaeon]
MIEASEGRLPPFAADHRFYEYVAEGYDRIAESYDKVEAQNSVGRRLRHEMQQALLVAFRPGERVLEIGCGTGLEATALAQRGVRVLATDVSQRMIGRVRARAAAMGLSAVEARCLGARDIGRLAAEFGSASFDGAYSHGGVLNMDPRPEAIVEGLATLLRPAGKFLCTVVNQTSLFEVLFYPSVFRPRKAFRRLGNVVPIPITRLETHRNYVIPARFYSPKSFLRYLDGAFDVRRLRGFGIVTPPWNLSDYLDRLEPFTRAAVAMDTWLSDKPMFREWGNVFQLELERRR